MVASSPHAPPFSLSFWFMKCVNSLFPAKNKCWWVSYLSVQEGQIGSERYPGWRWGRPLSGEAGWKKEAGKISTKLHV